MQQFAPVAWKTPLSEVVYRSHATGALQFLEAV